jgi:hypothetical protein
MKKQTAITIVIVLIVILIAVLGYVHYKTAEMVPAVTGTTTPDTDSAAPAVNGSISITESKINEANYTGSKPVIVGDGALADAARAYVDQSVKKFGDDADSQVPDLRKKFGNDAPPSHYTIDINAKTVSSATTESIVIDSYVYMGGANGSSLYKAFTAKSDGTVVGIKDIVSPANYTAFVAYVKKALLAWRPEGSTDPVVIADELSGLTIDSFSNFSFDDKNMTIYFDKYQIGPGALGAVAFPMPLTSVQSYVTLPQ